MRLHPCIISLALLLWTLACSAGSASYKLNLAEDTTSPFQYNITTAHEDPLIIYIDDFLTDKEITSLILAAPELSRSTGGLERTISAYRTSSTSWVNTQHVENKELREVLYNLEDRIAEFTGYPIENQEHFQVLRYGVGEYYRSHHDYIPEHKRMPCSVRMATFFLYLSDVDEGGETNFPYLDVRVMPKRGRAALWFNAYPETLDIDQRTQHEAMPVLKGEKWAANKWIHAGNFADNWKKGLTG